MSFRHNYQLRGVNNYSAGYNKYWRFLCLAMHAPSVMTTREQVYIFLHIYIYFLLLQSDLPTAADIHILCWWGTVTRSWPRENRSQVPPPTKHFFASFHNRDHEDPHILSEYVVGEGDGSHLRIIRELQHSLMLEPTWVLPTDMTPTTVFMNSRESALSRRIRSREGGCRGGTTPPPAQKILKNGLWYAYQFAYQKSQINQNIYDNKHSFSHNFRIHYFRINCKQAYIFPRSYQ